VSRSDNHKQATFCIAAASQSGAAAWFADAVVGVGGQTAELAS